MEQLQQLLTAFIVLIALLFLITRAAGLPSPKFGWLFLGGAQAVKGPLRGAAGRFVSTKHLTDAGPFRRAVIGAVAAADLATLALSASALAALRLQSVGTDEATTTATAAVIVAGIVVLMAARVAHPLLGSIVIFVVAAATGWIVAGATGDLTALLAVLLLALALLSVWPVGAAIFVLELVQISQSYGPEGVALTLVIVALVTALDLMLSAARIAWFATAAVVGLVVVVAFAGL